MQSLTLKSNPLQEESRPAEGAAQTPRFREIGVETELRLGDIMEVREHLASLEDIDHDYITRDAHDRTVEALERDHLLVAQHRCRHPIYFTDSGRCWHANYFCLKRQATTRIHQRDYCSLCSHELGDCMVPQDWERTLWRNAGGRNSDRGTRPIFFLLFQNVHDSPPVWIMSFTIVFAHIHVLFFSFDLWFNPHFQGNIG